MRSSGLRRAWRAVLVCVVGVVASCAAPPRGEPIPAGDPGSDGPCTSARTDIKNPLRPEFLVAIFEPTGSGSPWTGGTCDGANRPVVLFVHGWLASAPEIHEGYIDHLTSQGFIVIYPDYPNAFEPTVQYPITDAGIVAAMAAAATRVDASRVGVIGHSYGGGMAPWVIQQVTGHGWGSAALWAVIHAPHYAGLIPEGPIDLPPHARVLVQAYENDSWVDNQVGVELFESFDVPAGQKRHMTVVPDYGGYPGRSATHLAPINFESLPVHISGLSTDDEDPWAIYRPTDITARCSFDGTWCDADIEHMGLWPDGRPVNRAIASTQPVDRGVVSIQECGLFLNSRGC